MRTNAASSEPRRLVVIGGGMAGLSTALTWARTRDATREPVVLLEQQPRTGGFVTAYERRGYLFETSQMIPDISEILGFFDVSVEMRPYLGAYARIALVNPRSGDVRRIELPSGWDAFGDRLASRYPRDAQPIGRLLGHSRAMFQELYRLKVEPRPAELLATLVRCPKLVRNGPRTYLEYFNQFGIRDPEVREIFDVFAAFSGLPSDRVAAIMTVAAMGSLLDGAYRPKEGFWALPRALEAKLRSLGGEVRLGARAKKILVQEGRVTGVQLEGGEVIEADAVVTTVDTMLAMGELVGLEVLKAASPAYARKLRRVRMSPSSINVSLGLDDGLDLAGLGLDCGYTVVTTGGDSFARLFDEFERGRDGFSPERFHLGVICPSLTTGGRPCLTIRVVPVALGDWATWRERDRARYEAEKERWADFVVDLVERYVIPDLSKHVVVRDVSTPATYARYSGSPTGSIYDMAAFPDNFGRMRLAMRTPIRGLYQPKFTHGIIGSLLAGIQVNDMMSNRRIMNGNSRLPKR